MASVLERLQGSLIVSCQALEDSPLNKPAMMAAMAVAVVRAGAHAVRLDGPAVIAQVRSQLSVPILGIWKQRGRSPIYITPSYEAAEAVVRAGADLVAVQATEDRQPMDTPLADLITRIHDALSVPVVAEVATLREGRAAAQMGADALSTTMAGYTSARARTAGPDLALVRELSALGLPIIAEGRIRTPEEARQAFAAGAWCVVVGRAITMPEYLVQEFLKAMERSKAGRTPPGAW